jgi:hypothetical protein
VDGLMKALVIFNQGDNMKKQKGFIHITNADLLLALVIVMLAGWAIGHGIEWVWPYLKSVIHMATQ